MNNTPIDATIIKEKIKESGLKSVGSASIREIKRLVDEIENATGEKFIRMEMGVPGIPPAQIGVEAQIKALKNGIAGKYPDIQGLPELKNEFARFVKLFMDVDVQPKACIPTVGSMQGSFAAFLCMSRTNKNQDSTLFIDPGFPVHKMQHRALNLRYESFDVYNYRGEKLREKLESYFSTRRFHSVLYSNPNNPSWICFTDEELKIIAELSNKYNVAILEDLAYFGMDFRKDYSHPGEPPYQPTVARYSDNYILFVSSSKIFSYAGERIGMMAISDKLFNIELPDLLRFYKTDRLGYSLVFETIYPLSSGTSHSAQYALAAILKAANNGEFNFVDYVKDYGVKAHEMKEIFTDNGFSIVYDTDIDQPIADGFYFTFSYPGMEAEQLLNELVYYGISAISLLITGSDRTEGIRACTSLVSHEQFPDLRKRLKQFNKDHS
ncbi:MAG: pyridoxal phosphate-dependent aminotransferase [Bacteroidales bacterium]|nr:pyridoxal phosphate-dependent aminotransferase [Bacteroidales bacterium]